MEKDSNLLDDMFSDDYISSAHCSLTALTEPSPIAMNIQPYQHGNANANGWLKCNSIWKITFWTWVCYFIYIFFSKSTRKGF